MLNTYRTEGSNALKQEFHYNRNQNLVHETKRKYHLTSRAREIYIFIGGSIVLTLSIMFVAYMFIILGSIL